MTQTLPTQVMMMLIDFESNSEAWRAAHAKMLEEKRAIQACWPLQGPPTREQWESDGDDWEPA